MGNGQRVLAMLLGVLICAQAGQAARTREDDKMVKARQAMIRAIEADVWTTAGAIGRGRLSGEVMQAMAEVPRHLFVPREEQSAAYDNMPLPIGYGQTISQPYIVALMTDLAAVSPEAKVLEVGAGSGYQAAVLSHLVKEVHTIEIIPELARECRERLTQLGYTTITVHEGDGYYGLASEAPFDAILVTAAASTIPPPLVQQLRPGGRMVIPVGSPFAVQHLMLIEKNDQGEIRVRQVLPVQFVPLTGKRE